MPVLEDQPLLCGLSGSWYGIKGRGGVMGLLAVGKPTDETSLPRAQYLAISRHFWLLPPAAGGTTQTLDTHSARHSDGWLLALFAMTRMGQYECTLTNGLPSGTVSCLTPNSWTCGSTSFTFYLTTWLHNNHFFFLCWPDAANFRWANLCANVSALTAHIETFIQIRLVTKYNWCLSRRHKVFMQASVHSCTPLSLHVSKYLD